MDFDEQEEQVEDMARRVDVDRRQLGGWNSTYDSLPSPPPPQPPTQPPVGNLPTRGGRNVNGGKYKECLKNHAVSIGGHAVDGCGEFIGAGEEGTADALKCAACNCHRNFHRKEMEGSGTDVVGSFSLMGSTGGEAGGNRGGSGFHPHHPTHFTTAYNYHTPTSGYLHHLGPPPTLALPSTSGPGEGNREEREDMPNPMMMRLGSTSGSGSKKRFRTRFTQEQKERMLAFAERVGWRIQRHDEVVVQQFCSEIGVRRHVLKVWMHNNKNTLGKKP